MDGVVRKDDWLWRKPWLGFPTHSKRMEWKAFDKARVTGTA